MAGANWKNRDPPSPDKLCRTGSGDASEGEKEKDSAKGRGVNPGRRDAIEKDAKISLQSAAEQGKRLSLRKIDRSFAVN